MRIGLNLGYLTARSTLADLLVLTREAERMGFSVLWVAEAYGSDAPSLLSWLAGQTSSIHLGTAVMQMPARSPVMTAMTAATMHRFAGGRLRLGLGVSGPQVSEGLHGVSFESPLARTREYVEVVRLALSRGTVQYQGRHFTLPLRPNANRALRIDIPPVSPPPIYLAALGPRNLTLAGEVADGWLGLLMTPEYTETAVARLRAGRARTGRDFDGFDVAMTLPVVLGNDIAACADRVRTYAAQFLGGMGSREHNFYLRLAERMGFGAAAAQVQQRYLAGDLPGPAVPLDFIERTSLLGPVARIAEGLRAYATAGVTTLSVTLLTGDIAQGVKTLRAVVDALDLSGVRT
jgi:F420-dependent oxidoreductase-like protein